MPTYPQRDGIPPARSDVETKTKAIATGSQSSAAFVGERP